MKPVRVLAPAVALVLLAGGCGRAEPAMQMPVGSTPAPQCTETPATPAADRPAVLAGTTGSWYGSGDLWVGLPDHPPTAQGDALVLKFPWVTLRGDEPSSEVGPPEVTAQAGRGGAPGTATAAFGEWARSFGTGGLAFWPATIEFPGPGCWTVTGRLDGTTVQFVVEVAEP